MKTDALSNFILVATCVTYGAVAWMFQAYRVVPPRDWLRQRIRFLRARVDDTSEERLSLDWLDQTVKRAWWRLATSRVQAGWRHVHAIEDQLVLTLPSESVDEQLRTAA